MGGHSDSYKNANARGDRASGMCGRSRRGQRTEVIPQQTGLIANAKVTIWEIPETDRCFGLANSLKASRVVLIENAGVTACLPDGIFPSS